MNEQARDRTAAQPSSDSVRSQVAVGTQRTGRFKWSNVRRYPLLSGFVLVVLILVGVLAPIIEPKDPNDQELRARAAPGFWNPAWYDEHPKVTQRYFLGADEVGRDVLSRMMDGAKISLLVVVVALGAGMTVGTVLGLFSGYFSGMIDSAILLVWNIWAAIPFLLVALAIASVVGSSLAMVMGLLAMVSWSAFVRNVRAEVLVLRDRDFVQQARISGASPVRILWKHILPNVINTVIVIATLRVGGLILAEASLSFLGVGIPGPQATWGNMVADGRGFLADAWWIALWPGLAIFTVVMSLNFIGDWLRDRWDPRLRQV